MTEDESTSAEVYGVAFGPLKPALREHTYPVTREELIEQYGGFELDHPDGSDRLESVLRRADMATFREPRQVRDAILAELADHPANDHLSSDRVSDEAGDWSRISP